MAASDPITPFPPDIDRDYFGAWLSGFTDGEGCFQLTVDKRNLVPHANFIISLRKDDEKILQLIQSYLRCGTITFKPLRPTSKPLAVFSVGKITDLATIIVPHFERFPLIAKKVEDFWFWSQGVKIISTVTSRPRQYGGPTRQLPRWTDADRNAFYDLQDALCEQRKYR